MTLKEAGIDFKRIPLPEYTVQVTGDTYTPEIKKGNKKALIHDAKQMKLPEKEFRKTLGDDYEAYVRSHAQTKMNIIIEDKDVIWLSYENHQDIIEENHIYVPAYKKGTVVMDYKNKAASVHHGITKITIDEGGELQLIKIQDNHMDSQFIDHTQTEIDDRGKLKVVDIQLGSKNMIINYDTNLKGFQAECDYKNMYMAADDRGLDLSFTANHIGKKTKSDILGKGVLGGKSKKVFRGTLHFERGAVQSVGKEEEVVLLLSDDVKADSIPALMCTEDDVIGEHGASIGQLDEDRLFYLMSRGMDEQAAKLLVIQSSFREIIENIVDEEIKQASIEAVDRSMNHVI
jgi:FeS assembly protein SufD